MKVNLQRIYGQDNGVIAPANTGAARKNVNTATTALGADANSSGNGYDPNNLITKQERKFFIKMFPESSEQLEKHVLFTKNGTVTATATQKGVLLDGRA